MHKCLSATELNPVYRDFLTEAWLSECRLSRLFLFLTLTHTWTSSGCLPPLPSFPSPPLLASRVSHCLQAFHSAVLSPCSDSTFPFDHSPCMWRHDTRPGLVFPPCAVSWANRFCPHDNLAATGCSFLALIMTVYFYPMLYAEWHQMHIHASRQGIQCIAKMHFDISVARDKPLTIHT